MSSSPVIGNPVKQKQRVGIYCRLSEEDRDKLSEGDDSNSIQNQKRFLTSFAEEHEDWEIYGIYSDDDYAGADRNRPDWNRLLKDCENRDIDIVLCKTQSRFTREMELVERYLHFLFPLWGIRFISPVDGADTSVKGNKKARQINGLVNEWFLEDLSLSVKSVLTNRREAGFHIGAFAPYGYKKDPKRKGFLIIDDPAAKVIRLIFDLFEGGWGKTAIARHLNDQGIPNPTEYKRLNGIRTKAPTQSCSSLWKYSTISDILINEVYIGHMIQGKYESESWKTRKCRPTKKESWIRVENTHEPIISMRQWNSVQSMLKQRTKPFTNGKIGLFARTARCAYCGYVMRTSRSKGDRSYLQCPNHHVAKDACCGSFISVQKLSAMVLDEYRRLSDVYLDKSELERRLEFNSDLKAEIEDIRTRIKVFRSSIDDCSASIKNLLVNNAKGVVSQEDMMAALDELKAERESYKEKIAEGERQIAELEERLKEGDLRKAIFEKYACPDHLERGFVEGLIKNIYVWKRIPGTREIPIKIEWKF